MTVRARIAVIGAGWWASTVHIPALMVNPQADLVAICDPNPARAQSAAKEAGAHAYTDVTEMLATEGLDGVIIATPHSTHYAIAAEALKAGVNVLVEKPLATSASDAWELVTLAADRGLLLAAGLTYHYTAQAPAIRDAVRYDIGDLRSVNAEFSSSTGDFFVVVDESSANPNDPKAPHATTYSDPSTGGGQAHTQLTHLLGGLLWAAGEQATHVAAMTENHGLRVDLVDSFSFRLEGGALCVASSTGTTPPGVPPRHRIRFHGTKGMVEWDLLKAQADVFLEGGTVRQLENPDHLPSYGRERVSESFVNSIQTNAPTPAPGTFAAASVALIEAALFAAESGKTITVPQAPFDIRES